MPWPMARAKTAMADRRCDAIAERPRYAHRWTFRTGDSSSVCTLSMVVIFGLDGFALAPTRLGGCIQFAATCGVLQQRTCVLHE